MIPQKAEEIGQNQKNSIREVLLVHHMRELISLAIILAGLVLMDCPCQYGLEAHLIITHII
jgi:hypothetical protein